MEPHLLPFIRTLIFSLPSLLLLSTNSLAEQSYQSEFSGVYQKIDLEDTSAEFSIISAKMFFSPVTTDNKPLEEAAFLNKSSSLTLKYQQLKYKADSFEYSGPLVNINYITQANAFIVGAYFLKHDYDTGSELFTTDHKENGITVGKYLNSSTTVNFTYSKSKTESRLTGTDLAISFENDRYILSLKTIQSPDTNSFYSLGASFELSQYDSPINEDSRRLNLHGRYYFTRFTSLGASASFISSDNLAEEDKSLKIIATHFFSPKISFNAGFEKYFTDDNLAEDYDSVSFGIMARF